MCVILDINCETSDDCSSDKVCLDFKCEDPCLGVCGFNTVCHTVNNVYMKRNARTNTVEMSVKTLVDYTVIAKASDIVRFAPAVQDMFGIRSYRMSNTDNFKCVDPCDSVCGNNTICTVENHTIACACKPGFVGNPFQNCVSQVIKECTMDEDCPSNYTCNNGVCAETCNAVCDLNTIRIIKNYHAACSCKPGFVGNPFLEFEVQIKSISTIELQKKYYIGKEEIIKYRSFAVSIFIDTTFAFSEAARIFEIVIIVTSGWVTWTTAIERCRSMDMYFASITSPSELEDIKNAGKQSGIAGLVWVSGSDLGSAGEYVWNSTGKGFTYTNWKSGEPEVSDNYRCVALDTFDYKWQTRGCNFGRYYACEYFRS
ncbi:hypothetical protein J6590_073749 [Homalodisca vitripennis]|nr:hypothetical protein J6590_073749 [Homalodisca vitripennis]